MFINFKKSVLSRNYFLLENNKDDSAYMKKLNQRKVKWIIREIDNRIAKTMDITPQWAREQHQRFPQNTPISLS